MKEFQKLFESSRAVTESSYGKKSVKKVAKHIQHVDNEGSIKSKNESALRNFNVYPTFQQWLKFMDENAVKLHGKDPYCVALELGMRTERRTNRSAYVPSPQKKRWLPFWGMHLSWLLPPYNDEAVMRCQSHDAEFFRHYGETADLSNIQKYAAIALEETIATMRPDTLNKWKAGNDI